MDSKSFVNSIVALGLQITAEEAKQLQIAFIRANPPMPRNLLNSIRSIRQSRIGGSLVIVFEDPKKCSNVRCMFCWNTRRGISGYHTKGICGL